MKKTVCGLLIFSMAWGPWACAPHESIKENQATTVKETKRVKNNYTGPKRRIGIVDFENKAPYGQGRLGNTATDILITELTKTGKFIVVERDKINSLMAEQKFGESGAVDPNTAAKVGRILGLNAIVTGAVTGFGVDTTGSEYILTSSKKQTAKATVDIRVVDVETGQILLADSGEGVATSSEHDVLGLGGRGGYDENLEGDALRAALVKFVDNIVNQVNTKPWSCRVAAVEGDQVYLDAGQASGLGVGQKLTAYHTGKDIVSPTTGLVIGQTEDEIASLEVVRFFGDDGSIAKVTKGSLPSSKDICRFEGQ
jgi:curli biogenesis system outer membrane secretion channel CsgG